MTTSTGWAEAVLVITVLAPVAAIVLAVGIALPGDDHRWTTAGCAVSATGALVLLVSGQHPQIARLAPDDLALAASTAIALLALGARAAASPPMLAAAVTVALCGVTAGAPGEPSIVGPVLGLAAAVALVAVVRDTAPLIVATIAVGTVAVAAGVRSGGHGGASVALVGAAFVTVLAAIGARRAIAIVVPVALTLGLRTAPAVASTSTARWVAVVVGCAAVALVIAVLLVPRFPAMAFGAALGPWALVAALEPVPGTAGAARVLAAATVLALLLGGPLALIASVPGAAVLVSSLADGQGWPRPVLGVLVALTLAGVLRGASAGTRARLRPVDGVALALAVWLVVRPTAWTWAHASLDRAYDEGTVVALASGLIATAMLRATTVPSSLTPVATWLVVDDEAPTEARSRIATPVAVVTVALGIAAALLLRSARL